MEFLNKSIIFLFEGYNVMFFGWLSLLLSTLGMTVSRHKIHQSS